MMGCSPGTSRKPSFVIPARKWTVLARSRWRRVSLRSSKSSTVSDAAQMAGINALEKR